MQPVSIDRVERFGRECIVAVYDLSAWDGEPSFVLGDYLDGRLQPRATPRYATAEAARAAGLRTVRGWAGVGA